MVYLFSSSATDPPTTLYMGKDKYENEELIKNAHPTDVWFHVDNLSSAHVYIEVSDTAESVALLGEMNAPSFRVHKNLSVAPAPISEELLKDCYQLTKHHSIEGSKRQSVNLVYTPAFNLRKTAGMEPGEVGFHCHDLVKRVTGIQRDTVNLKRLLRTRTETDTNALLMLNKDRDRQVRERLRVMEQEKKEQEIANIKANKERQELESYSSLFAAAQPVSNRNQVIDEDDFM